ncbi:uncharacterized protein GGS25DRAFT_307978 [Hypoxylon fragiforme]|uniref:uncharacterized protein n=1 Tax=Hypoxylon fragiforme TaxID=63214 RepID=UPI0020C64FCE|nr:uncharacterized protein GGS25DRAFT_307978 [Hypoxylon fragiforme]KAI2606832.1 hypothetical protein GGS25DRAFT_307978 [Hypoxylon fragiforme]
MLFLVPALWLLLYLVWLFSFFPLFLFSSFPLFLFSSFPTFSFYFLLCMYSDYHITNLGMYYAVLCSKLLVTRSRPRRFSSLSTALHIAVSEWSSCRSRLVRYMHVCMYVVCFRVLSQLITDFLHVIVPNILLPSRYLQVLHNVMYRCSYIHIK